MWIDKAAILALVLNVARAGDTVCGGQYLCDLNMMKPINQIGDDPFYTMLVKHPNTDDDDEEFTGYTMISFMKGDEEYMDIKAFSWDGERCEVTHHEDCKVVGDGCGDINHAASFLVADDGDYLAFYTVWPPTNKHYMEIFTRTYKGPEINASNLPAGFLADIRKRCCDEVTKDRFYKRKFPVKHFIPYCSR